MNEFEEKKAQKRRQEAFNKLRPRTRERLTYLNINANNIESKTAMKILTMRRVDTSMVVDIESRFRLAPHVIDDDNKVKLTYEWQPDPSTGHGLYEVYPIWSESGEAYGPPVAWFVSSLDAVKYVKTNQHEYRNCG